MIKHSSFSSDLNFSAVSFHMKTIDEEVGHDEPGEGPVVNGLTADSSSPFADMPLAVTPFAVTPDGIRRIQLDIEPDDAVECMPLKVHDRLHSHFSPGDISVNFVLPYYNSLLQHKPS